MQELILIISRCLSKRKKVGGPGDYYKFHFKGFYAGERIKMIHLFAAGDQLTKGDDYLLWVKKKRVYCEKLEVELVKFKKIE